MIGDYNVQKIDINNPSIKNTLEFNGLPWNKYENLTTLKLKESVYIFKSGSFNRCESLKYIFIPGAQGKDILVMCNCFNKCSQKLHFFIRARGDFKPRLIYGRETFKGTEYTVTHYDN